MACGPRARPIWLSPPELAACQKKQPKPLTPPPPGARPASRTLPKIAAKRLNGKSADDTPERIARALEAIAAHLAMSAPTVTAAVSFADADAFVWHPNGRLSAVPRVSRVEIDLLKGIDRMRDILIDNTERFADGLPANN